MPPEITSSSPALERIQAIFGPTVEITPLEDGRFAIKVGESANGLLKIQSDSDSDFNWSHVQCTYDEDAFFFVEIIQVISDSSTAFAFPFNFVAKRRARLEHSIEGFEGTIAFPAGDETENERIAQIQRATYLELVSADRVRLLAEQVQDIESLLSHHTPVEHRTELRGLTQRLLNAVLQSEL